MPVRLAILGCGEWGRNHVRVFSERRDSRVTLCVDPDPACLDLVRERYGKLRCAADPEAAWRDPRVDAVVVATPTASHFALAREALRAGKDVLVEKPLCTSSAEAEELVRLARRRGRVLMVGHLFLYNDGARKLRDLMHSGVLGRTYYLHATRTNLGPIRRDVSVVWDLAAHDVSIFRWLLGAEPREVSARGQRILQDGVEDVAFLSFVFPDGVLAHVHASWLDPKKVREVTVVGDRKMAVWSDMNAQEPIRVYDKGVMSARQYETYGDFPWVVRDGDILIPKMAYTEPLKNQAQHFLECVRARTEPLTGGRDGLAVVRALEAATRSMARGGASVRV